MPTYQVGYFVGSLSSTSINRILSKALIMVAPADLEFTEIPIGNLPLYSQDYDRDFPAASMPRYVRSAAATRGLRGLQARASTREGDLRWTS